MIIAVDFDGTCVEHRYPAIGAEVPGVVDTLRDLVSAGHKLILWTMRSGERLTEAVLWFQDRGIDLWDRNRNPMQKSWTSSPKVFAHVYIDDAAFGCPLVHPDEGRPYVNWWAVREKLLDKHTVS